MTQRLRSAADLPSAVKQEDEKLRLEIDKAKLDRDTARANMLLALLALLTVLINTWNLTRDTANSEAVARAVASAPQFQQRIETLVPTEHTPQLVNEAALASVHDVFDVQGADISGLDTLTLVSLAGLGGEIRRTFVCSRPPALIATTSPNGAYTFAIRVPLVRREARNLSRRLGALRSGYLNSQPTWFRQSVQIDADVR